MATTLMERQRGKIYAESQMRLKFDPAIPLLEIYSK